MTHLVFVKYGRKERVNLESRQGKTTVLTTLELLPVLDMLRDEVRPVASGLDSFAASL